MKNQTREFSEDEWEAVRSIFEKRGVRREVAEARPYVPYTRGDDWVAAPDGPFAAIPSGQRGPTIVRDVRAADGLVMVKHPVPLTRRTLTAFPPQLRPTPDPITGSIVNHDHADPWMTKASREEHIDKVHGGIDVVGIHDNYRPDMHRHGSIPKEDRAEHLAGKHHHGLPVRLDDGLQTEVGDRAANALRDQTLHACSEPGKYKIPASPLVTVGEPHVHPVSARNCMHRPPCASDAEHTKKHLAKYKHWGVEHVLVGVPGDMVDVKGRAPYIPADGELHFHGYRKRDRSGPSYGKRVDIHPMGVPLLKRARDEGGITFVSMEGNLKADSILAEVLFDRRDLPDSVVDIPSVAQWRAPEMKDFAEEWLDGCRLVFLVCDSDWSDPSKYDVQRQAFAFREYLRLMLGPGRVHVAAPPEPEERDKWGDPVKIGVDDWIGSGGTRDGLVVVEREPAPAMRKWADDHLRMSNEDVPGDRRNRKTEARLMALMSLVSKPDGRGRASVSSLHTFTSLARNTVSDALENLRWSALKPAHGPLEALRRAEPSIGYRGKVTATRNDEGEWVTNDSRQEQDTVTWTIREGYRWHDLHTPYRTVGDMRDLR